MRGYRDFVRIDTVLLCIAALKFTIHFWVNLHDRIFRDELYYIACGKHLALGYVDHPPFIGVVAALSDLVFPDSLLALRALAAIAGAAVVFLTGTLCRQLGGGHFAQGLAALCVLVCPTFLGVHGTFSMNVFDHLFWVIGMCLLAQIAREDKPRLWLWFGLVLGIGLMNKISVLFFGMGVFVGIAATPYRQWFVKKWIWISAGIAFLVFLPHVLWQVAYGWPTREFIHNATMYKNVSVTPWQFIMAQIEQMHPLLFPIWLAGLLWFFLSSKGKPFRFLGWVYVAVLVLLIVKSGKSYYLAPAYPMLFAAGAIVTADAIQHVQWNWLRPAVCIIVVAAGVVTAPMALPVLSPEAFVKYASSIGIIPSSGERHDMGRLPQHFADRYGWEEMAAVVAGVYSGLSPDEQSQCVIFAQNYGEAGAIDYYGEQYGLPRAISGHNNYYLWGPGERSGEVIIVIGGSADDHASFFEDVRQVATIVHKYAMPYESNLPVYLCRTPKVPLREVWPTVKSYG